MKIELVTNLKRQATKILSDLHDNKEPILITEHGKPSAYLLDVDHFENLQNRMAILEGVNRGETAFQEGRTLTSKQAKARMAKWLK
jgi:prevent-host-death family protein